jgi:carboxypeptidase Taq
MSAAYAELLKVLKEVAALTSTASLLGWDQETMMPAATGAARAEQLALISRLAHERATDPRIDDLLARCEADGTLLEDPGVAANLREMRRDYDRSRKLPSEFVGELQETCSRALEAWKAARRDDDFSAFEPWLTRLLSLTHRKAEYFGAPEGGELYDALLDEYEPEMTGRELERIFVPLREALTPLIAETTQSQHQPNLDVRGLRFPLDKQKELNAFVVERVGFDLDAGRLDVSVHPFSTGIAPGDTRITTRYGEEDFPEALGSTMHETGHGLYEQGLPRAEHWGQPLGESLGLGIHESQSRMWENHVGRSRAFWDWLMPHAKALLGPELDPYSASDAYEAVNVVRPGLIRVESDEATYSLHVMLRFDLERAMIRGDLKPADLPGAWNERIRSDLGLEVPGDGQGCLQDIHWSMGAIGYFPTYTLGSLYAAQFWEALCRDVGGIEESLRAGDFRPVLAWLREKIHRHGRRYPAAELCRTLTGEPLTHEPLLRHLRAKLDPIYRLDGQATGA